MIQLALFDAKLSAFVRNGVPGPDLPALLEHCRAQQDREEFAAVRPALLLFDLLAGRLDDARRGIAASGHPTGAAWQAVEGTAEFLAGLNEAALQHWRTKAAVLSELPPRTEQTMQVEVGEAERAFYEAMRQRALETIAALDTAEGKRKIHILAEITRLRRACCNPALIDPAAGVPSGKLDAFLDLVDDLVRNRHRALVFSQFVGHLGLVRAARG